MKIYWNILSYNAIHLIYLQRKQRRMVKYGKLVMIHEENAPLPPPFQTISCQHS